jgi:hypothetical protein
MSCRESHPILDASDPILLLASYLILENSEQQIAAGNGTQASPRIS